MAWESVQEEELMHIITNQKFDCGEDTWVWKEGEDEVYTVKSAYNLLQNISVEESNDLFDVLWSLKALPNAQYFRP